VFLGCFWAVLKTYAPSKITVKTLKMTEKTLKNHDFFHSFWLICFANFLVFRMRARGGARAEEENRRQVNLVLSIQSLLS
jgi:hypothetical protein